MLERLVPLAQHTQRTALLDALTSDAETLFAVATSPYGSHLLEALVDSEALLVEDAAPTPLLTSIAQHIGDLVSHKYGSFFVRHVLRGGVKGTHNNKGASGGAAGNQAGGLASLLKLFDEASGGWAHHQHSKSTELIATTLASAVAQQQNLVDWPYHPYASPFMQALLRAIPPGLGNTRALWDALVLGVLSEGGSADGEEDAPEKHPKKKKKSSKKQQTSGVTRFQATAQQHASAAHDIMRDRAGSHFFEAVFSSAAADPPTHDALCNALLPDDQLLSLAQHPHANFALQAALVSSNESAADNHGGATNTAPAQRPASSSTTPAALTARALDTLAPAIGKLLVSQRGGVVVALVLAASRNVEQYGAAMCAALATPGKQLSGGDDGAKKSTASLAPLLHLLYLDRPNASSSLPDIAEASPPLSTIGCALLQLVFTHFPQTQCQLFANALASLPHAHVLTLATHPGGVRVLEAFLLGPASKKQRRTVLHALRDSWAQIALRGMAGCVFCEKCFTSVCTEGDIVSRESIVKTLAPRVVELGRNSAGAGLLSALHVEAYARDADAWRKRQQDTGGGKRAAAAFLEDVVGGAEDDGGEKSHQEEGVVEEKKRKKKHKKQRREEGGEKAIGGFVDMLSVGL